MLQRIFPKVFDNRYLGQSAALWLFGLLMFLHLGISLVAIFRADGGAQSADGIPLDRFGADAAQAVIGVVAFLGLARLMTDLLAVVALLRYRTMVPLLLLMMLLEQGGHKLVRAMKPIGRTGVTTGSYVSLGLLALTVLALGLSLVGRRYGEREG